MRLFKKVKMIFLFVLSEKKYKYSNLRYLKILSEHLHTEYYKL